jgi:ABC-type nitrate/sulfonate/bicarbonate transport system substrate-binding protein
MKKPLYPALVFILLLLLAASYLFWSDRQTVLQTVRLADVPILASAMVYVAEEKGYFAREGIEIAYSPQASGKEALEATLRGEVDVALVAETPLVLAMLSGQPVSILATVCETDSFIHLVADGRAGIAAPADLRGKRIGTPTGTNAEFFLSVYLLLNRIAESEVEIVDLPPEDTARALLEGRVAAVSTWHPHVATIQEELSQAAVSFFAPIYRMTMNLATAPEWTASHREKVLGLLRALKSAEQFIEENPRAALHLVETRLGDASGRLGEQWDEYGFDLKLGQTLLLNMEDQARWARARHYAPLAPMPDFLATMNARDMQVVDPRSTTVIHQ